jgi:hypothetical protein
MPNHIHLVWCKQEKWINRNIPQIFLNKYTAQQIKFGMIDEGRTRELEQYRSTQQDRQYHFWERQPYGARMLSRKAASQKIDYMHFNPVKAGLCKYPEEYKYSSAKYFGWSVTTPTTGGSSN